MAHGRIVVSGSAAGLTERELCAEKPPRGPAPAGMAYMSGLKPRNRLVNFRLTEEEYGRLAAVCVCRGSPSISDFARAAILRTVEAEAVRKGPVDTLLAALSQRLSDLERGFRSLAEPPADGAVRSPEK